MTFGRLACLQSFKAIQACGKWSKQANGLISGFSVEPPDDQRAYVIRDAHAVAPSLRLRPTIQLIIMRIAPTDIS